MVKAKMGKVDPMFIDWFKEYKKKGLVNSLPEFTRTITQKYKFEKKKEEFEFNIFK